MNITISGWSTSGSRALTSPSVACWPGAAVPASDDHEEGENRTSGQRCQDRLSLATPHLAVGLFELADEQSQDQIGNMCATHGTTVPDQAGR
jgi:hypothetical protein